MTEREKFDKWWSDVSFTSIDTARAAWYAAAANYAKEIEQLRQQLAEKVEHINTLNSHVAESLQLLGVDVSIYGYIPDSWTLREQCKIAGDKIRDRDERLRVCDTFLGGVMLGIASSGFSKDIEGLTYTPEFHAARQACKEGE